MTQPQSHARKAVLQQLEKELALREKLDTTTILFRQIERCDISAINPDPSIFETNVRILLSKLPSPTILKIRARSTEFNETISEPQIESWCGVPIVDHDDKGEPLPPPMIEREQTDYEKLYEIIMQELEVLKITWTIEQSTVELGKVRIDEEIVPGPVVKYIKKEFERLIITARGMGFEGAFEDIIERLRRESMPSPYIIKKKKDPEEEDENGNAGN